MAGGQQQHMVSIGVDRAVTFGKLPQTADFDYFDFVVVVRGGTSVGKFSSLVSHHLRSSSYRYLGVLLS